MSELMLQQTQVARVIPKYRAFLRAWPVPAALARAPLADVLRAWSGLGYNRRARFLWLAARAVAADHGGAMPRTVAGLESLPGVGRYTARAVASFAYGQDVTLWDVNVRRVFLRFFCGGEFAPARRTGPTAAGKRGESALEALLGLALPRGRSRDWHGALMDLGSALCTARAPRCRACPLRATCLAAPHFLRGAVPRAALGKKQAAFKGSRREVRGAILRALGERGPLTRAALLAALPERLRAGAHDADEVLAELAGERLVARRGGRWGLGGGGG